MPEPACGGHRDRMNRRNLLILLTGSGFAWPLPAGAQQKAMPVIGYLAIATSASNALLLPAFLRGLSETAMSRDRTQLSNIVGRRTAMIGCLLWLPISLPARS